ncbi:MAG: hypothetical protein JWN32_2585, partial [Solirubrobacterales bacterium]|nr:hypothetical protein [Solirubrobacterales bacterium]
MSRRRRGVLRLGLALALVAGAAVAVAVAASGGSNPRRAASVLATVTPSTPATTPTVARRSSGPAAPALVVSPAVRKLATGLSLDRQVAQLFLVGFRGTDTTAPFFTQLPARDWGGAMLTHDNYVNAGQLGTLAAEVTTVAKTAGHVAPLVAAPQVGGKASAFPDLPPAGEPAL